MIPPHPTGANLDHVYLDHAASTPVRPEVAEAMAPFLADCFANPSGGHRQARAARQAVDQAREQVAEALGAEPDEVVFTSGGTEADNAAVFGVHRARGGSVPPARTDAPVAGHDESTPTGPGEGTILCSAIEHPAVRAPVALLGGSTIPVDEFGAVALDALASMLHPDVHLVSVMLANNEVGTVQPLRAVATLVAEQAPRAVVHTDAVQAVAWLDVARLARPAHLVSISAHKFGGPKGSGALVVRAGTPWAGLLVGGGQEHGRRAGTHNVAGIVGLATALVATVAERTDTVERVGAMRDRLAQGLVDRVAGLVRTAERAATVAGSCHVCIPGIESEALLVLLDRHGLAAAAGASCASGALEASPVLVAMGVPDDLARGSLRLSLGSTTTDADIDTAIEIVATAAEQLRSCP